MHESQNRHRGKHYDPVGAVLGTVWAVGHAVVIVLLGVTSHNQFNADHLGADRAANSVLDRELPA
ncbi:hypothetical protein GCM10010430_74390 [Kitasatospora cystarginea]|uniref:Uncharacterized protein n=1 Tax=Kitasatospora cystarginea TaxID=58350 RepID=A0ABN3EYL8_9ACTN